MAIIGLQVASWTDNLTIIAAQVLARNATPLRGTFDLRTCRGGYLFAKFGRGGTAALTNGVRLKVFPLVNNAGASVGAIHPAGRDLNSFSTAAATSTAVNSDSAAAQNVLNVISSASFLADQNVCIQDSGGGVTRLEWNQVSKTGAGTLTMVEPLSFAHTAAQADTVRNMADVFEEIPLRGGTLWGVYVDYGDDASGDSITVQVLGQRYDQDNFDDGL